MTLKEFEKWSALQLRRGSGKTQANVAFINQMYIPVVLEHISGHGCSGLKCKSCPLNTVCDRDTKKVREYAIKMLALIKMREQKGE